MLDENEQEEAMTLAVLESILADDIPDFESGLDCGEPQVTTETPLAAADLSLPLLDEAMAMPVDTLPPATNWVPAEATTSTKSDQPVIHDVGQLNDTLAAKKKSTKTKRADRKAALQQKALEKALKQQMQHADIKSEPLQTSAMSVVRVEEEPSSSSLGSAKPEEETKEDKKQRRLIRNRMSAQLHRERKKAYVDHLEGLVRDREAEIASLRAEMEALKEENASLRAARTESGVVSVDGLSEGRSSSENEASDSESSTVSRKRARKAPGRVVAAAMLTAMTCVALLGTSPVQVTLEDPPIRAESRRALLSDAPFAEDAFAPASLTDASFSAAPLAAESMDENALDKARAYLPGVEDAINPAVWAFERDVAGEVFAFPAQRGTAGTVRVASVIDNDRRNRTTTKLRGSRTNGTTSLAPYTTAEADAAVQGDAATSYVICSSATGVFGRNDYDNENDPTAPKRPRRALLALPSAISRDPVTPIDDFIQLLVPSHEVDLRSWGHDTAIGSQDLWLEVGAQLRYGRLVHNINIHPIS